MTRITASLISASLLALTINPGPAQAQPARVFVAAQGSDANLCTFAQPCRTFQHAHDVVVAGGEIDVLDPAGYGAVNITKSLSIQGHGFSGITVTGGNAISINAPEDAIVNLNGLLLEGSGTGDFGIGLSTAGFVTITNTVIRRFALSGLGLGPRNVLRTAIINVSNTIVANNGQSGAVVQPFNAQKLTVASFSRVEAYGNGQEGIFINASFTTERVFTTAVDCVAVGNGFVGLFGGVHAKGASALVGIVRSVVTGNDLFDVFTEDSAVIEIGGSQVFSWLGGHIVSYGDNYKREGFAAETTIPRQ